MPMKRKAMAVLTLSSIAFLLAVILFYSRTSALIQGAETNYLGENEIALYSTYLEGEKQLLFMDIAAQNSFRKAGKFIQRSEEGFDRKKPIDTLKANPEQFLKDFSDEFAKYLPEFNKAYPGADLKMEDYTFKIDSRGLVGITEKEIMISTKYHNYTFTPNFRVFIETRMTGEITFSPETGDIVNSGTFEQTTAAEPAAQPGEQTTGVVQPLISEDTIEIEGDDSCKEQTMAALELLKTKVTEEYDLAIETIGKIRCVEEEKSEIIPFDTPSTYLAGKHSRTSGAAWYAGTIVHSACRLGLYADYKKTHEGPVPDEWWNGEEAEWTCITAQINTLNKLEAPQSEVSALYYAKIPWW